MIVQLTVLILTLIIGWYYSHGSSSFVNSDSNRLKYIRVISIILILQSGLRNVAVGSDTYAYYLHFERVKGMYWDEIFYAFFDYFKFGEGKDPGYLALQKILQYVLPNYQLFLFFIAILFFTALGNFFLKNSKKLSDAIFAYVLYSVLFYAFFSITGHRQTIATAFTLFSFEFIKKRKFVYFLLLIIIGSTIHKSCLVFIPFYFVANIKYSKLIYGLTIAIFPIVFFFRDRLVIILTKLGGYEQYSQFKGTGTYVFTFILIIVVLFALWRIKFVLREHKNAKAFYNAFALAVFFTPLTWVNPSAMRIVQYFSIFMLVLIPFAIDSLKYERRNLSKWVYGIAIITLLLLFFKTSGTIDYKFFWQDMKLGANYW